MIVVSAKDLTKAYGTDVILDKVSFHINKGDRVGIIGVNGAGKTTLLRMLTGEIPCEEGECFISGDLQIGYLKQDAGFDSEKTVIEEARAVFRHFPEMEREMERLLQQVSSYSETAGDGSADGEASAREMARLMERYELIHDRYDRMGGYSYQSELRGILSSMAFDESVYDKKISALSGGERTRLALALLLLEKPDILFLDEPTNHLDIGTLKWLEQYLKGYRGTIVLVSHDRYFLNETVTRIFEVENHRLNIYEGNYQFYAAERKVRRETELRTYEKQQREIARQEDMIRRFKQRGTEKLAKRAASREKQLERMERVDRPDGDHGRMSLRFHQEYQSGRDVLQVQDLSKSFGFGSRRRELFHGVEMDIKRGERVCIVGDNGTGKTYNSDKIYKNVAYSYVESVVEPAGIYSYRRTWMNWGLGQDTKNRAYFSSFLLGIGVYTDSTTTGGTNFNGEGTTADYGKMLINESNGGTYTKWNVGYRANSDRPAATIYFDKGSYNNLSDQNVRIQTFVNNVSSDEDEITTISTDGIYEYSGNVDTFEDEGSNSSNIREGNADFLKLQKSSSSARNVGESYLQYFASTGGNEGTSGTYTLMLNYHTPAGYNDVYLTHSYTITVKTVNKSALRSAVQTVVNKDPDTVTTSPTNGGKGYNPQEWYYSAGWPALYAAQPSS